MVGALNGGLRRWERCVVRCIRKALRLEANRAIRTKRRDEVLTRKNLHARLGREYIESNSTLWRDKAAG